MMPLNDLEDLVERRRLAGWAGFELAAAKSIAPVWSETLRLAALDVIFAATELQAEMANGASTEEQVKATLLDRWIEFCRCRDRVLGLMVLS